MLLLVLSVVLLVSVFSMWFVGFDVEIIGSCVCVVLMKFIVFSCVLEMRFGLCVLI